MKTKRLGTILTSNCLSAILALCVALIGTAVAEPPPKTKPVMTDELMARLIKYVRDIQGTSTVPARISKILDLNDGTKDMTFKVAKSDAKDGEHYFALPPSVNSKDILILVKRDTIMEVYLTDKTGKLHAAAISENGTARLITKEKASEKFKAELTLFAKEATEQLPPTAITAPSKK